MPIATRTPFRTSATKIIREFMVAVTLCAIVVAFAGGTSDVSMRVGVIIAAIYLMAAEIFRQVPELARHATAPFRRLLRPDSQTHAPTSSSESWVELSEFTRALEALVAVTRESIDAQAHVNQSIGRTMLDLSKAFSDHEREMARLVDRIAHQSVAHESLLRDAIRQLDQIVANLGSTTADSPPSRGPSDLTSIAFFNYDAEGQYTATEAFPKLTETTVLWRSSPELTLNFGNVLVHDLILQNVSLHSRGPHLTMSRYRELPSPVLYRRQAELFRALRSDPETLKRFIDEIVTRIIYPER